MAIDNFIPEIWSGTLLSTLKKSLVYGGVANRNYQGDITAAGDTVKINEIGNVTISDYTKNASTLTFETLTGAQKELKIDQAKSFSFEIDDIDNAQTTPKIMNDAMVQSGYQLRDTADQFIAGKFGDAANEVGTVLVPINITSVNAVENISLMAQALDENNVPLEQRWMVIPPWFKHKLVLAKITLDTNNSDTFTNGFIGRILGFNLFVSNNVSVTTPATNQNAKIMAGGTEAITFAEQIVSIEALRPEASFSDAMKGLYVYGAKVVRPKSLVTLYADYTAEP